MTCVTKDRDTIQLVTVQGFDSETGSAQRGLGKPSINAEKARNKAQCTLVLYKNLRNRTHFTP